MWHPSLFTKREKIHTARRADLHADDGFAWVRGSLRNALQSGLIFCGEEASAGEQVAAARYSRQRRRSARIHQREHIGWNEGFIPGAANQVPLAYWLEKEKVAWFVPAAAAFTYHNYNIYYSQAAAAARTTCNYAALVPPTAQKTP
jgi:hypothetical protein